ncbi:MAG: hypothetical protein J6D17_14830 [Bacteroides sp.]|nr:hypothetical protein [Bacteroides sp.]
MSENMNDINHLDTDDVGLSQIFGRDIRDVSSTPAAVKPATPRKSTTPKKKSAPAVVEPPKAEPVIPVQQSVESDSYSWLPQLKAAVHGIMPPALMCTFFFWCQQTARMDSTTAVVAMFGCVALVFFRVGRVCAK